MENYLYAFINNYISQKQFENLVYEFVDVISSELGDKSILSDILECDYNSFNEVIHLKTIIKSFLLSIGYDTEKNLLDCDDAYLLNMIYDNEKSSELPKEMIFDCTNIDTTFKLHLQIKKVFKFPEWYGMNWAAFNDILDLSDVKEISIINYDKMHSFIKEDAETFIEIINERKKGTIIIFTNNINSTKQQKKNEQSY
jgi:RNAse (barnase) inhibitor barstar